MIAIIFELTPKSDKKADYLEPAAEMRPMIEDVTSLDYFPISGSPPLPEGPENKLTYGLYSPGISDEQKREIVEGVRLPTELAL